MSFKHPEILYTLFALLIPILIHLFQLQRFVKVSFTNVKFLKEIELQTRKSSKLKKLLLLATRMLALAMLIVAFAEPYFGTKKLEQEQHNIIYLDNSLSMLTKSNQTNVLQQVSQQIVEHLPQKGNFSLITNDNVLSNLDRESFKEQLLQIQPSHTTIDLQQRLLSLKPHLQQFGKNSKLLWFSDFQKTKNDESFPDFSNHNTHLIWLKNEGKNNLSIDSVYITKYEIDAKEIILKIKNQGEAVENIMVSAMQNNIVLSKTNINIGKDQTTETSLRITGNPKKVKLLISANDAFEFDNTYFMVFKAPEKIKVLLVANSNSFLNKIYTEYEFIVTQKNTKQVGINDFEKNQLVVLNEPENIPSNLMPLIHNYLNQGGNVCIIPAPNADVSNLNNLLQTFKAGQISNQRSADSLLVNTIHFSHPLMQNVFKKQVANFQYPSVRSAYVGLLTNAQPILSLSNKQPFISGMRIGQGHFYWVASSLKLSDSNFINSPLVVPVFYNMAVISGLPQQLAYRIGEDNNIKITTVLQKDEVISLQSETEQFIPEQQIAVDYVKLHTVEEPSKAGFYDVVFNTENLGTLAFNTPKTESNLIFWNVNEVIKNQKNVKLYTQVTDVMNDWLSGEMEKSYFRWFIALALLFLLTEIAIIKYL